VFSYLTIPFYTSPEPQPLGLQQVLSRTHQGTSSLSEVNAIATQPSHAFH
jgi:hypothetical protein